MRHVQKQTLGPAAIPISRDNSQLVQFGPRSLSSPWNNETFFDQRYERFYIEFEVSQAIIFCIF